MKQFSLEEYLRLKEEGKDPKIVTRVGKPVRILCTDLKTKGYPIVAAIDFRDSERVFTCTKNGYFLLEEDTDDNDLFFAPTKHQGWINIYREANGTRHRSGLFYDTEQRAMAAAWEDKYYVATAKVEWEE